MKKLTLLLCLAACVASAQQGTLRRTIDSTSDFSRRLLANKTRMEWLEDLGILELYAPGERTFSGTFNGIHLGDGSALSGVLHEIPGDVLRDNDRQRSLNGNFTGNFIGSASASGAFFGQLVGTHSGDGNGLYNLNGVNIALGTINYTSFDIETQGMLGGGPEGPPVTPVVINAGSGISVSQDPPGTFAISVSYYSDLLRVNGNGSQLTSLSGGNITAGTIPLTALSTIPISAASAQFSIATVGPTKTLSLAATPVFNGSGITGLNADQLASGTVPMLRLGSSGSRSSSTFLNGAGAWVDQSTFRDANAIVMNDARAVTLNNTLTVQGATTTPRILAQASQIATPNVLGYTTINGIASGKFVKAGANGILEGADISIPNRTYAMSSIAQDGTFLVDWDYDYYIYTHTQNSPITVLGFQNTPAGQNVDWVVVTIINNSGADRNVNISKTIWSTPAGSPNTNPGMSAYKFFNLEAGFMGVLSFAMYPGQGVTTVTWTKLAKVQ